MDELGCSPVLVNFVLKVIYLLEVIGDGVLQLGVVVADSLAKSVIEGLKILDRLFVGHCLCIGIISLRNDIVKIASDLQHSSIKVGNDCSKAVDADRILFSQILCRLCHSAHHVNPGIHLNDRIAKDVDVNNFVNLIVVGDIDIQFLSQGIHAIVEQASHRIHNVLLVGVLINAVTQAGAQNVDIFLRVILLELVVDGIKLAVYFRLGVVIAQRILQGLEEVLLKYIEIELLVDVRTESRA